MNQQPPPVPSSLPPKNSGLAIWSLVLGILSLTCFWLLAAIPAVICGHLAYSRIKQSRGALEGSGLALGGIITGYLSIALSIFIIPLLAAIAIPNFVKARQTAQMNACINNLRVIDGAKQEWALENKKKETEKPSENDIAPYLHGAMPVCPAGGTYTIGTVGERPRCSVAGHQLPSD